MSTSHEHHPEVLHSDRYGFVNSRNTMCIFRYLSTLVLRGSCFLLAAVLVPTGLRAQGLDTIPWSIDLSDVVVTAQFAPTSAQEAVHRVEVLRAEEWQSRGLNTLSEVLQQRLNMRINPDPILGNGLSIQGLGGQNIQVMIDGVPVVGRLGGDIDLSQLNLAQFARIEIITGAMSAQFGSNAAGGVINLISKPFQPDTWRVEAGGQVESFGLDNQYARVGRRLGAWQVDGGVQRHRAHFTGVDSLRARREVLGPDGTRRTERVVPWNPKTQFGYDANLTFRPHDSLQIRYGYRAFDEELTLYGEVRRPVFRPYAIDQFFTTRRRDHHLSARYWLAPDWYWQTTAGLNTYDRFKDTRRLDIEPDTTRTEPGGRDTTRYTGTLLRTSFSHTGSGRWSQQFGLEYLRETAAGQRILDAAGQDEEPVMHNLATWVNLRYQPTAELTLEGNLRAGYNSRYDHPLIPGVNVLWRPAANWQWRASYARGFRAPSIQELFFRFIDVNHFIVGSDNLRAERAHNVRLQGEWSSQRESTNQQITIGGALFYNAIRDRITLVESEAGRFTYANLDVYRTHGVNLELSWQWSPDLELRIGGGYTRLYNPLSEENSALDPYIGLSEMSNSLHYHFRALATDVQLVHRYLGRQDRYVLSQGGTIEQGFVADYHLVDLSLQRPLWGERIRLGAGVKNLLDQEQVAVTGGSGGGAHAGGNGSRLIAFGRSFFLRVDVQL